MAKNPGSTAIKIENRIRILKALLYNEKNVKTLRKELDLSHKTITTHLNSMEKDGLIKQFFSGNKREKFNKITSKGLKELNELDNELKGRIFTAHVFSDINKLFQFDFIFDNRLSEESFKEMFEGLKTIYNNTENPERRLALLTVYQDDCLGIIGQEKIPPLDSALSLRKEFFEFLSNQIGEALLFLSIKYSEDKKLDNLTLLSTLPMLLTSRIEGMANIGDEDKVNKRLIAIKNQFKIHNSRWNVYEEYLQVSRNMTTVKNYEKMVKTFAREPDISLLGAIGEDFSKEGGIKLRRLKHFKPSKKEKQKIHDLLKKLKIN